VRPDDIDLDEVQQQLERRRAEIRERIAALAARPELGAAQGFGKRVGDGTVEAISRLTEIGVGESLEATLEHTERALTKIADGTYGSCDACRTPIPLARLRAMPDRSLCVSCAATLPSSSPPRRR
jgi:DnaK suppressor protein